ncbi:hypothetical protein FP435_00120 (plasmid) [Lactobacillus sp. PV037]|uniref:hypothetical protein n=1 Tax=Lactobacillus sp. PV037 TaxID=2594496 RepID=UPI00223F45EE|nr:hypothetical protein [Lactobacillus sp. PV037]QNQ82943.1 hypothetical protein FP435_00120 [Lactobacillus sp. PV037]
MGLEEHENNYLENLNHTPVGWGENYKQHKLDCEFGCVFCAPLRRKEQKIKEMKDEEIAGVSGDRIVALRQKYQQQATIRSFFPDKTVIRTENGSINPDVYLVLQLEDFSDDEIRRYFNISHAQWVSFKRRQFPNWKDDKDEILNTRALEAMMKYRNAN